MGKTSSVYKMDTVFVLFVFCVFAASVLMVLMLGGNVYKNTNEIIHEDYEERTCLSYIWTRVKNGDEAERVYIEEFYGLTALCLEEVYSEGDAYRTIIYLYEGWMQELFSEVGYEFFPEDGNPIMQVDELAFEQLEEGLIRATSGTGSVLLYPRGRLAKGK